MKEQEVIAQFEPAFSSFLREFGGSILSSLCPPRTGEARPDLIVEADIRGTKKTLVIELRGLGQPRYLREAMMQLKAYAARIPNSYGMVVAPFIAEQSARVLEENGVGYFDLAGNCLLNFDNLFIRSRGNPNPNPLTRELKSLFEAKSSRIVRVMLTGVAGRSVGDIGWTVQELARKAQVSLGLASAVKKKLLDFEYVEERNRLLFLKKPGELLDEWARNYPPKRTRTLGLYTMHQDVGALEDDLASRLPPIAAVSGGYAFTSFSGARRIAPFVRYTSAAIYFSRPVQEVKDSLNAKEVPTGANLNVLVPYDEGVSYGSRQIRGAWIVGTVQLYLDLVTDKGRGEEAAQVIRETELKY